MEIKKIFFLFDREEFRVDFENETIEKTYTYMCDQFPLRPKINIKKFYEEFSKFEVEKWQDSYINDDFSSNERWDLQIYCKNDKDNIFKYGKAKFPENFFELKKLFEETESMAVEELKTNES